MTRFIVVPQWQGSPSPRAMQLVDGAEAIADDLPRSATLRLEVPLEAGDALGSGVQRLSSLLRVRAEVERAVEEVHDTAVIVGGDCAVAVGAISALRGDDLAVVWLDAHPDLHTAESSPSGAFSGMALRSILGHGPDGMTVPPGVLPPARAVLAGTREIDLEEELFIAGEGLRTLSCAEMSDHEALGDAVMATGATRVFVHVDLDVLDPAEIRGVAAAQPFGVGAADLVASIRALRARVPLAGASLTGFAPPTPTAAVDDLGTILRIVGALA